MKRKSYFGSLSDGSKAYVYTVSNGKITFSASDYGCTITSIIVKDRNGKNTDVVLGPQTLSGYAMEWGSYGAIVGRFANRINGAKFSINGKEYLLNDNLKGVCLHGGFPRWENIIWSGKFIKKGGYSGIRFYREFEDGYQGFPGNLKVTVDYLLKDEEILLNYKAITDQDTPVSITNHSYFNLSGYGNILHEKLKLDCDKVLELDENSVPTGKILDVKGTAFDFTSEKTLKEDFDKEELKKSQGYDHCFVTKAYDSESAVPSSLKNPVKAAELSDDKTGLKLELFTNCEGLQLYTANYVSFVAGKYGAFYGKQNAVCLETQAFPDSPNQTAFPSTILTPGTEYNSITLLKFSRF